MVHNIDQTMRTDLRQILLLILCAIFIACTVPSGPAIPGPSTVNGYQWTHSTPQAQGVDSAALHSALELFRSDDKVFSFILTRNGTVVEEYYRSDLHPYNEFELRSATKSFVSVLVGIALHQGLIDSLDQPMLSFFPEYDTPSLDARTRTITIRHLLTMRAGFDYSDAEPKPWLYTAQDDWVGRTIALPLKYTPGEQYYYASVQTHLLSAIITRRSGLSTLAYARRYLLDRAGIRVGHWDQDPQGIHFGGSGMTMTALDMARFGEIVRRQGMTAQDTLVPNGWMPQCVVPTRPSNSTWGVISGVNYGMLWWLCRNGSDSLFFAAGSGGQYIVIVPVKQAVIVTTADPNQSAELIGAQEDRLFDRIVRSVLPALQ